MRQTYVCFGIFTSSGLCITSEQNFPLLITLGSCKLSAEECVRERVAATQTLLLGYSALNDSLFPVPYDQSLLIVSIMVILSHSDVPKQIVRRLVQLHNISFSLSSPFLFFLPFSSFLISQPVSRVRTSKALRHHNLLNSGKIPMFDNFARTYPHTHTQKHKHICLCTHMHTRAHKAMRTRSTKLRQNPKNTHSLQYTGTLAVVTPPETTPLSANAKINIKKKNSKKSSKRPIILSDLAKCFTLLLTKNTNTYCSHIHTHKHTFTSNQSQKSSFLIFHEGG